MDDTIKKIKDYVLVISPELVDDKYLDFVIDEVVDRALVYTNRQQLLETESVPLPSELERVLARVVVLSYKTISDNVDSESPGIKSIQDNGQSITYGDNVASYLSSKDDTDIFSSVKLLLDKFRIPTIVENT